MLNEVGIFLSNTIQYCNKYNNNAFMHIQWKNKPTIYSLHKPLLHEIIECNGVNEKNNIMTRFLLWKYIIFEKINKLNKD